MTFRRSYENAESGQQLYAVLEAFKKPELLWAKLATGNYDWLGVRRNGRYVVGRPRLTAIPEEDEARLPDPDDDRHRIESRGPLSHVPHWEAYSSADEARDAYARIVSGDPVTPMRNTGVWKVRLILDGELVEEILVVRALPRMV